MAMATKLDRLWLYTKGFSYKVTRPFDQVVLWNYATN